MSQRLIRRLRRLFSTIKSSEMTRHVGLVLLTCVVWCLVDDAVARDEAGVRQFFIDQSRPVSREPDGYLIGAQHRLADDGDAAGWSKRHVASARKVHDPMSRQRTSKMLMARRLLTIHANRSPLSTANGVVGTAVRPASMYEDPTLRYGDAVMTTRGLRIFQGATTFPFRDVDFATVLMAQGLDKTVRRALVEADASVLGHVPGPSAHL